MNKWTWIWTGWIVLIIASFFGFEITAIVTNGTTLSHFTWNVTAEFPLLPWLGGVLAGGLAVHFWWSGNPNNPT